MRGIRSEQHISTPNPTHTNDNGSQTNMKRVEPSPGINQEEPNGNVVRMARLRLSIGEGKECI